MLGKLFHQRPGYDHKRNWCIGRECRQYGIKSHRRTRWWNNTLNHDEPKLDKITWRTMLWFTFQQLVKPCLCWWVDCDITQDHNRACSLFEYLKFIVKNGCLNCSHPRWSKKRWLWMLQRFLYCNWSWNPRHKEWIQIDLLHAKFERSVASRLFRWAMLLW